MGVRAHRSRCPRCPGARRSARPPPDRAPRATARSSGSAMVWSPPMVSSRVPSAPRSPARPSRSVRTASPMSNGLARDVAGVGDLLHGERRDVQGGVVGAEQPGGRADVGRAEPGPGPVADPAVEGHADHGDVGAADLVERGSRAKVAGRANRGTSVASTGSDGRGWKSSALSTFGRRGGGGNEIGRRELSAEQPWLPLGAIAVAMMACQGPAACCGPAPSGGGPPHAPTARVTDPRRDRRHRRQAAGRPQGARLHPRAAGRVGQPDQGFPEPGRAGRDVPERGVADHAVRGDEPGRGVPLRRTGGRPGPA